MVFEARLLGGLLGIWRTFIFHAHGSKLPSDLLGLASVRDDPATIATPALDVVKVAFAAKCPEKTRLCRLLHTPPQRACEARKSLSTGTFGGAVATS